MIRMDKALTLEEIRKAQEVILQELSGGVVTTERQLLLEQATLHLRELERLLVSTFEKSLTKSLKKETVALHHLIEQMEVTSRKLEKLTTILRKIVTVTGRIIDILELAK